jgi:glycosyltransferase involved in cell wall biosynthesis
MKILEILHHSQAEFEKEVRLYHDDWHVRVADQILRNTDAWEVECWRPEKSIRRTVEGEEGGLKYRIFPSSVRAGIEWSMPMLRELKRESQKNDVLVHLQGIHNPLSWMIASRCRDIPVIGQQLGDASMITHSRISTHPLRFLYLLPHQYEKRALEYIDRFFVMTGYEKEIIDGLVGPGRAEILPIGVDFTQYSPLPRKDARKFLDLPQDKKILLYVGRLHPVKRADLILSAFRELKNLYDVELIVIGAQRQDPFYEEAVKSGARLFPRIPPDRVKPYYSAADVYCFSMQMNLVGGVGVAPIEALACGTPVVSNTLLHVPGEDRVLLGEIPRDDGDFVACIGRVLANPGKYARCREIASCYFDWSGIVQHTVKVITLLGERYFSTG